MTNPNRPLRIVAITGSLGLAVSSAVAAAPGLMSDAEARLEYVRTLAQKGAFELFWTDETGERARVKQLSQKHNKIDTDRRRPPKNPEDQD